MRKLDDEVVVQLEALISRATKSCVLILAQTKRPSPQTIDALREEISRSCVQSYDLGIWYRVQRDAKAKREELPPLSRDTTPGFLGRSRQAGPHANHRADGSDVETKQPANVDLTAAKVPAGEEGGGAEPGQKRRSRD